MATPSIRNLFLCLLLLFVIVNFLVFVLKPQVLRRVVGEKSFDEGGCGVSVECWGFFG